MTDSGRASIYRGRLIELGLEPAELPNGATIELEIVRHPGGAVVLALDEETGCVCCSSIVTSSETGSGNCQRV